ncbi:hypothetical protein KIN20_005378 [Parelaphostrongylus tenuis]|uniref:Uncharacterized protein n=1 Tax=Parelaphostrongylus tenuis TaxID=148309 RepID=A0AAD5QF37_PARTN|nr:hypothetical protein KIN20_005378 [Parelaphostrongylus tenuis]
MGVIYLLHSMLAKSAEGDIGDEADDSMEDNTFATDDRLSKALSLKTLSFDGDTQVFNAT